MARQIVLDTETTGLEPSQGHRIIEIGCLELVDRHITGNNYHQYINPQRSIDSGAERVHGISNAKLADKPVFADIVDEFLAYIRGAELIIHNAPFDVGFLNHEFALLTKGLGRVAEYCSVIDTLTMARQMHPGQRNSLDALCRRYDIDNMHRQLHGALLDAELLALVYLHMTGGQTSLFSTNDDRVTQVNDTQLRRVDKKGRQARIIKASADELEAHQAFMESIDKD